MNIINLLFDWCADADGIPSVLSMIRNVLNVLRFVVPIALIALTTIDVIKNVINPNEKDGQQKIMIRAIAALIVFLAPTLIKFSLRVIDWGRDGSNIWEDSKSGLSRCWR